MFDTRETRASEYLALFLIAVGIWVAGFAMGYNYLIIKAAQS